MKQAGISAVNPKQAFVDEFIQMYGTDSRTRFTVLLVHRAGLLPAMMIKPS